LARKDKDTGNNITKGDDDNVLEQRTETHGKIRVLDEIIAENDDDCSQEI